MLRIVIACAIVVPSLSACDKGQDKTQPPAPVSAPAANVTAVENPAEQIADTPIAADNDTATLQTDMVTIDVDAGMQLANVQCQNCHGESGNQAKAGTPFIAGQHAPYLVSAMQAYTNDGRQQEDMKKALQALKETDLGNIAAFYASQTAQWKPLKISTQKTEPSISPSDIKAGEKKSTSCRGCHGPDGNSQLSGIPSLAGMPPDYFKQALTSYFNASRSEKKVIMKNFKNAISKKDIHQLAAYYSAQKPLKSNLPAKGNSKAGEKTASQQCIGCHGLNGNSGNPNIPSLSGQNADYLTRAINDYKTGQRKNDVMKGAVAALSDKEITNIAVYFARQTPQKINLTAASNDKNFDPLGQGEAIAAACVGCHGAQGNSTTPKTPSLAGLHQTYLSAAIRAYKLEERKHKTMKGFVASLTEPSIEKVSLYFASQAPVISKVTLKADASAGEKIASACTACHGEQGNSTQASTPAIAGQEANYLVAAINQYKSALRQNQAMQDAVSALKDDDIKNLAAYFASQARLKPEVKIPEAPEILAQKCNRCHGENGHSTDPAIPRIATQNEDYLINALKAYRSQKRTHTIMYAMTEVLSDLEISAIAKFYATQE